MERRGRQPGAPGQEHPLRPRQLVIVAWDAVGRTEHPVRPAVGHHLAFANEKARPWTGAGLRRGPRVDQPRLRRATGARLSPRNLRGLTTAPFSQTSKCTWAPVERPVEPALATSCPARTRSPLFTTRRELCA